MEYENLLILAAFLALGLITLVLMEWRERKRKKGAEANPQADHMVRVPVDDECCGRHAVCERESLLTTKPEIVYYDDEELDRLSGLSPEEYTPEDMRESMSRPSASLRERGLKLLPSATKTRSSDSTCVNIAIAEKF